MKKKSKVLIILLFVLLLSLIHGVASLAYTHTGLEKRIDYCFETRRW